MTWPRWRRPERATQMADGSLRDFLYLDAERVRSYLAQLLQGVPETTAATSGSDAGIKSGLEGGGPWLAKAAFNAEYLLRREQSETKSLHHHQYSLLEAALVRSKRLTQLDADSAGAAWPPDVAGGGFVRAVGSLRLLDYALLKVMLPQVDQMMYAARTLGWFEEMASSPDGAGLAKFSDMIDAELAKVIRVKLSPSPTHPERILAGVANRSYLQWTPAEARLNARMCPQGTWVLVGQLNPPALLKPAEAPPRLPVGNLREDQLDALAPTVDSLHGMFDGVSLPCVSVNLISIYREC